MYRQRASLVLTCSILLLSSITVAQSSDLEKGLPTEAGWRSVRWGMSLSEVAAAFGKDFKSKSRSKNELNANVAELGALNNKVILNGVEFEVTLGFNASDRLNHIRFTAKGPRKESFEAIRNSIVQTYGDVYGREFWYFPSGRDRYEGTIFRKGNRLITLKTMSSDQAPFVTGRRIDVNVWVPDSESQFGAPGHYLSSRGVFLRDYLRLDTLNRVRKDPGLLAGIDPDCNLELNRSRQSIRIDCNGKTMVDKTLGATDRVILENSSMRIVSKDGSRPAFFFLLVPELSAAITESFGERVETPKFPAAAALDKKLLKDIHSKHNTKVDYGGHNEVNPIAGKALLVAIRQRKGDELFGWGLQEKIHVDDRAVIVNLAGAYGTAILDPGEHVISAQGYFDQAAQLRMVFEPGRVYYFLHGEISNGRGSFLVRVSEELGQLELGYAYPSRTDRKPG